LLQQVTGPLSWEESPNSKGRENVGTGGRVRFTQCPMRALQRRNLHQSPLRRKGGKGWTGTSEKGNLGKFVKENSAAPKGGTGPLLRPRIGGSKGTKGKPGKQKFPSMRIKNVPIRGNVWGAQKLKDNTGTKSSERKAHKGEGKKKTTHKPFIYRRGVTGKGDEKRSLEKGQSCRQGGVDD